MHRSPQMTPLSRFFGTYLHQDFADLYGDAWSAVEAYVAESRPADRREARNELVEVLRSCRTEDQLSAAADRLRLDYHPPGAGETYRAWLEKVERYLREHES